MYDHTLPWAVKKEQRCIFQTTCSRALIASFRLNDIVTHTQCHACPPILITLKLGLIPQRQTTDAASEKERLSQRLIHKLTVAIKFSTKPVRSLLI